jgi:hypothetical protein
MATAAQPTETPPPPPPAAPTGSRLETDLALAANGWHIQLAHSVTQGRCSCGKPDCESPGKHPIFPGWQKKATTDPAVILDLRTRHPRANTLIATGPESDLIVLDIDPKRGGSDSLAELEANYGPLPHTVRVRTGGGGQHIYFRYPTDTRISISKDKVGPGIDGRGAGGLVIAPGSRHASGGEYQFEPGCGPADTAVAELPAWLKELMVGAAGPRQAEQRPEPNLHVVPPRQSAPDASEGVVIRTKTAEKHYAERALEKACERVRALTAGGRREGLNREAFPIFQFAYAGLLDPGLVREKMIAAAISTGLDEETVRQKLAGTEAAAAAQHRRPTLKDDYAPPASEDGDAGLTDEERELRSLAALSDIEYERAREEAAEKLDFKPAALDRLVKTRRAEAKKKAAGEAVVEKDLLPTWKAEPWPTPVDSAELLDELADAFAEHAILPPGGADAAALWTLHAWAHDAAIISPFLTYESPEKRCGKTTSLKLHALLAPRALTMANVTMAALFRMLEKYRPTAIIDEADTFLRKDDELRGVLNSGHDRGSAYVIRTVGDDFEPKLFSTWAPKAIGLIGRLPDTLTDRSIVIPMRRKRPDEKVRRLRTDRPPAFVEDLRCKAARWRDDNLEALRSADPEMPRVLSDRAADNWRPLLAIADLAGAGWGERARAAAAVLSGNGGQEDESARAMLLADIRDVFNDRGEKVSSADLADVLAKLEHRPWPEWKHGKPITPKQIASLLKPFEIKPKTVRIDGDTPKGRELEQFTDAFLRYLSAQTPQTGFSSATPQQGNDSEHLDDFSSATAGDVWRIENARKPLQHKGCGVVADGEGENETLVEEGAQLTAVPAEPVGLFPQGSEPWGAETEGEL